MMDQLLREFVGAVRATTRTVYWRNRRNGKLVRRQVRCITHDEVICRARLLPGSGQRRGPILVLVLGGTT